MNNINPLNKTTHSAKVSRLFYDFQKHGSAFFFLLSLQFFFKCGSWSGTWHQIFFNLFMGFLLYYLYSITVWSAAPQTTLWGGPGPRIEPGPGGPEAGTLPLDHHTSLKTTTPPPHQIYHEKPLMFSPYFLKFQTTWIRIQIPVSGSESGPAVKKTASDTKRMALDAKTCDQSINSF